MNMPPIKPEMQSICRKIVLEQEKFLSQSKSVPYGHSLKLSEEDWSILLKNEPNMAKGKTYMGLIVV